MSLTKRSSARAALCGDSDSDSSPSPSSASFSLERAKSGRSTCKKCRSKIEKNDFRIGAITVDDHMGYERIKWYHVSCFAMRGAPGSRLHALKRGDSASIASFVADRALLRDDTTDQILSTNDGAQEVTRLLLEGRGGGPLPATATAAAATSTWTPAAGEERVVSRSPMSSSSAAAVAAAAAPAVAAASGRGSTAAAAGEATEAPNGDAADGAATARGGEGEEDSDEGEDNSEHLCTVTLTIVGLRYYSGIAHQGEYVRLVREPSNPYDPNAIRVDNIHNNNKVGHIKATQARHVAPLLDDMDRCGVTAVDGVIPRPAGTYVQPVEVEWYGDPNRRMDLVSSLRPAGAVVGPGVDQMSPARSPTAQSRRNKKSGAAMGAEAAPAVSTRTSVVTDWRSQKELDAMFDAQKSALSKLASVPVPSQVKTTLLPHQMTGLSWLVHREMANDDKPFMYRRIEERGRNVWFSEITNASQDEPPKRVKGGLLCDEMGMGKSLMTLALLLSNPAAGRENNAGVAVEGADGQEASSLLPSGENGSRGDDGAAPSLPPGGATTLVVCPLSVMANWQDQVERHVRPGVLSVAMYQGPDRHEVLSEVFNNKVDILLVSYQTLATEFRTKFDDNGTNGRNGKKKKASKRRKTPAAGSTSVFDVPFHRVVLDEAHTIRNANTQACKACLRLTATNKLCLTGTPLQNRPDDVRPLLQFVGLEPVDDANVFRRAISQPIRGGDEAGLARLRAVMCHVALRRTKEGEGIELSDKTVSICTVQFPRGSVHEQIYGALFESAREAFRAVLSGGEQNALKEYMGILEALLRVRQACCSGLLVPKERLERAEEVLEELQKRREAGSDAPLTAEEGKRLLEKLKGVFSEKGHSASDGGDEATAECCVCLEEFDEAQAIILRKCSHVYCRLCITRIQKNVCPMCRTEFDNCDVVNASELNTAAAKTEDGDASAASLTGRDTSYLDASVEELAQAPKVVALLQAIELMQTEEKGVIFSQWTTFLDIVAAVMRNAGHTFTRIDGKMKAQDRVEAVKRFNSDDEGGPRFILCSLHAAGTGINLTRGNHCFMMDLWWNKGAEDQAMDRIHRIGQSRDVSVTKFVMENSIEERIVKMQQAKAALGKGALEKLSPAEVRQARISALKDLFQVESSEEPES